MSFGHDLTHFDYYWKDLHMNNKKLLIGCLLALIAIACGSTPATVPGPGERLAPADRLATLTPTGAPAIETPTESPPTETLAPELPTPATETPIPLPTEAVVPADTPACECSVDTYNCGDALEQTCYRHCLSIGAGDVHGLDGDGDGIACQGD